MIRASGRSRTESRQNEGKDIAEFDLTSGLDTLNSVEVAKEREYTVPFSMRCVFDLRDGNTRCNVRFVRSGLIMKDKAGVVHGMVAEFAPVITADKLSKLKLNAEGILVLRVADVPRILTTEPIINKFGRLTGEYRIRFVHAPKFVSFVPRQTK